MVELPKELVNFTQLTKLYLYDNEYLQYSESFNKLTNLTSFTLVNSLDKCPNIEDLCQLQVLCLNGNKISDIPDYIYSFSKLEHLGLK